MINSVTKRVSAKPNYPYLGFIEDTGVVVLFCKPNVGISVGSVGGNLIPGSDGPWNEGGFEVFFGSVTIENDG